MMRPHFLRRMAGRTRRVPINTLRRLTRIISSHMSIGMSSRKLIVSMPALLHRMSPPPGAAVMAPKPCAICASSPTSAAAAMARTPSLAVSSAAVLAPAALRSTMPMSAPSAASAPTIARPIPLAPPVTSAVLPLSLPMVPILSCCGRLVLACADAQEPVRLLLEVGEVVDRLVERCHPVVMEAADIVPGADGGRLGARRAASLPDERAATGQRAARRQVDRTGNLALERDGAGA